MEVRTEPWPSRRGNGPHPVGWPVQRIHPLACEAATPVCFGLGLASRASKVPRYRRHPLKPEALTVSPACPVHEKDHLGCEHNLTLPSNMVLKRPIASILWPKLELWKI